MNAPTQHVPVMLDELLTWLAPRPGMLLVDGTFGGGGHAVPLANAVGAGRLIGIDRDPQALERGRTLVGSLPIELVHGSYTELPAILAARAIKAVDGIVLDLGLSSDQLADRDRGFSFHHDGELDLRFDTTTGDPAWRLLARWSEQQIADAIYQFGDERFSRRIARRIVERRRDHPIRLASELADLVRSCVPRSRGHAIDPATRTFQALRIATNQELDRLAAALRDFPECLQPGGRLAIISFHSLEDRLVKQAFRNDPRYLPLTRKPIRPNECEVARNPRARSARLRVAQRA